ncbi:ABC transporter A family member 2-like isoform X2 [Rhododendron vialii]|uniref:ABC transporter A family member 2-like isoform X2 n=1 Tax=Rhododendron vialii TaxID=182163 RepID=UPI00265D796D|nr:ABC transporter A family member 2-like isoform X2 [Rhododendron vialii]
MELLRGYPLLAQQFRALFRKNLILAWRNKRSTFLQLFSSLFFIFGLFCIQKSLKVQFATTTTYDDVPDPKPLVSPPIPPCEDKFYVKLPCFDFVWSGNDSSRIASIVSSIMANNPGRPIPSDKVMAFRTKREVDDWLLSNPMTCPGALHFTERNAAVITYGIQTNSTSVEKRGQYEDPTFKFQIPLQLAAEREIARSLIRDPNFSWVVSLKEFAHPAVESILVVGLAGPTFFLATAMFGFVFQISSLITEKELKLRQVLICISSASFVSSQNSFQSSHVTFPQQAMSMMGLYDTAYWFSWLIWEGILAVLSSTLTVLFGMMFQFDFFLHNSFGVVFFLFFLFQLNMISYAFMLSAFISKSSSSTVAGFSIFIIGFLTQASNPLLDFEANVTYPVSMMDFSFSLQVVTQVGFPYSSSFSGTFRFVWSLFPPNLLTEGLILLSVATATPNDPGVSWSQRGKCAPNDTQCVMTLNDIYIWLISTFLVWFFLAIYFDNIIPNSAGVRKSVFYFLNPGYWTGKGGNKVAEGGICSCTSSGPPPEDVTPDDEDVYEEENTVKQAASEDVVDTNIAVQIRGLVKMYPGTTKIGCCKCTKTSHYHALKGLWVNFPKDQLFCLLGPNGAGKTTAINCLTGITPVTAGDALIYGDSVRSSIGMTNIRRIIGVCPQFDILWDGLSAQEHLHLFASIKGLPPALIESVAQKSLAEVRLTEAAKITSGSYSGGMKRRLSVAIALIGDPKLVILDEPVCQKIFLLITSPLLIICSPEVSFNSQTTGMDPITRRHVWDIIENAKKGRAIILTTHSMEEADILSDRIGIMAKGRLRCIGTSIRLKSKFGTGFVANISFSGATNGNPLRGDDEIVVNHRPVKQFFKDQLNVVPKEENKSFLTYVIPHDREGLLTNFFAELQDREREFGIEDIQLGLTTLEEVFLNIAKQAELESAAAEETLETLTLTSRTSVQKPLLPFTRLKQKPMGVRYVEIPGTESAEIPGTESAENAKGAMVEVCWEQGVMVEVCWEQHDSGALSFSRSGLFSPNEFFD